MATEIWTLGHSNRDLDVFLNLLRESAIELVADVRRFPASRVHAHFNEAPLKRELQHAGLAYRHFEALGGRRSKRLPHSPNTAWKVEAFNAYADHMSTPDFHSAFEELMALAGQQRTAILCAEALPWRCHRRLIADALISLGWTVWDIISPGQVRPHRMTPFARLSAGHVVYPSATLSS